MRYGIMGAGTGDSRLEKARAKLSNIKTLVDDLWNRSPAVARWCRMCMTAVEYLNLATQLRDDRMQDSDIFRKVVGYLMLPPKRVPDGMYLEKEKWNRVIYYSPQEVQDMTLSMENLRQQLRQWVMACGGDEPLDADETENPPFAARIWPDVRDMNSARQFKDNEGRKMFCRKYLNFLKNQMDAKPLCPPSSFVYMGDMGAEAEGDDPSRQAETVGLLQRIEQNTAESAACARLTAADVMADSPSRKRVGTDSEIAQENEVYRRVKENGFRGLRRIVANVLSLPQWQFRDGHPNTDKGRAKCYSRVYEQMHPTRRMRD